MKKAKEVIERKVASFVATATVSMLLLATFSLANASDPLADGNCLEQPNPDAFCGDGLLCSSSGEGCIEIGTCVNDNDCLVGDCGGEGVCEPPQGFGCLNDDECAGRCDQLNQVCVGDCKGDEDCEDGFCNQVNNVCVGKSPEPPAPPFLEEPIATIPEDTLFPEQSSSTDLAGETLFTSNFDEGDAVELGDVNGDGVLDIIVAKDDNGRLEISSSINSYSAPIMQPLPDTSFDAGDTFKVGDVDGDGIEEIVIVGDETGEVRIIDLPIVQP